MEFKKIDISATTFKEISDAMWDAYINEDGETAKEDMQAALKNVMFNVKPEYIDGEWNDCTIAPPNHYDLEDVIIRRKGRLTYGERKHTSNIGEYKLAYFRAAENRFVDENGTNVLRGVAPSEFEYKFIE